MGGYVLLFRSKIGCFPAAIGVKSRRGDLNGGLSLRKTDRELPETFSFGGEARNHRPHNSSE